ncbi:helix-turn-helix transcriptional regulator [Aneurinibacillus thermoaerophilus]
MMLAERLLHMRKRKKKTQEEMAKFLGITRPAYTAYETGRRQPDYETLSKLADYFDTTTDYLLGRTNNPLSYKAEHFSAIINDPEINTFFKDYLSAPKEKREELQRFWKFMKQEEEEDK